MELLASSLIAALPLIAQMQPLVDNFFSREPSSARRIEDQGPDIHAGKMAFQSPHHAIHVHHATTAFHDLLDRLDQLLSGCRGGRGSGHRRSVFSVGDGA